MNEEQKNIETCLPENILAEVANVPTDPQFVSLTDEALDPLQQQALQQAGYDGYKEVVMYHKPYTFTSQVKQMKSNLILLLRRLWRSPFGRGTIRSLSDMWQHYITRLKGNPEYGIPSSLSQLTDLPSAPALLADRDMSSGIRFGTNPLPDGMSLAQLLCSTTAASSVTEIVDTNIGWTMDRSLPTMEGVTKATIGCKTLHADISKSLPNAEELTFTGLDHIDTGETGAPQINIIYGDKVKKIYMPALKRFRVVNATYNGFFYNLTGDCEIYMENCEYMSAVGGGSYPQGFSNIQGVKKIVFGTPHEYFNMGVMTYGDYTKSYNLIHLEIGAGADCNIGLANWTANNALDASRTDLIEEGSTATNNLEQFLSNFKTYIAERLTDNGSGLTLTLSQEVRNVIHAAEDEYGIENIIITKKGWTISPAPN